MADSERLETGGHGAGDAVKRREELDQLLHRIAVHIAEVDKSAGERPEPVEPAGDGDAVGSGPALQDRSGAEPPPLRSAMTSRADEVPSRREAHEGNVGRAPREEHSSPMSRAHDTGARAEPHATDEPWDSDAAEALTRSYEAEAAVPPLRSILNLMAQRGAPQSEIETRGAGRSGAPFHGEIGHGDIDAAQTRLFEAAQRVETMLDRLAPREAVEALGDRFETLEGEVRRSGGQLARLDGIEHRLDVLGEKLSDEQVLNLFGSLVPTADELTQFAENAAGRAAERVLEAYARDTAPAARANAESEAGSSSMVGNQLDALADVLGTFMDERRRNEAGTLEALETLQLAMQHVLDRIERAEERAAPATAAPIEHVGASPNKAFSERTRLQARSALDEEPDRFQRMNPAASELDDVPGEMVNLTANQIGDAPDLTAESYSMPESGMHDDAHEVGAEGYGEMPSQAHHGAEAFTPVSGPGTPLQGAHMGAEGQPLSDRQAFIAMARKAAERARNQADQSAKGKPETPAPAKPRKGGALALGASTGIVRPGVLLVAIAAILFAGYWFLFGQKHGLLRPFATVSVERLQAVAASANSIQPQSNVGRAAPASDAARADAASARPRASNTSNEPVTPAVSVPGHREASAAPVVIETAGPGMTISFDSSPATFDTVMRARERSRLAGLSQRAAFSAVSSNGAQDTTAQALARPPSSVPPRHTSAIETSAVAGHAAPASSASVAASARDARQMNLPPAATGPLSLRLAAAGGDAAAQLEVATRLAEGRGVRQSFAEAARWYERAADQGQAIAQYRLATLYERGMGVKADRQKARALYEKAAAQGNLKAMHNLAVISASATGGSPDYVTAARLFSRAAQHGLHDSQYNLGVLYESGLGVPKDHGSAYKWYALAARSGDEAAARRRDMLISRLPSETIQAMDAQIASWQAVTADEAANNVRVAGSAWMQGGGQTRRQ